MSKRAAVDQQSLGFTTNKVPWSLHIRPTVSSCIGSPPSSMMACSFNEKLPPITFNTEATFDSSTPEMHQSNSQSEWRTKRRQRRSRRPLTSWFRSVGPFEAQRIRRNDTAVTVGGNSSTTTTHNNRSAEVQLADLQYSRLWLSFCKCVSYRYVHIWYMYVRIVRR